MNLLLLDTSGPVAGVALIEDGIVRYEGMAINSFTHSQSIMPMVEEAYRRTGLTAESTDYFAVTVGPGSFTGVRIGVSTVKGLAHASNKPCIEVDALESMAAGVMLFEGVICPIQDARAGQVYGAAFEGTTLCRLLPDEPIKLEDYLEKVSSLGERFMFLGDGMPVHRQKIAEIMGERAVFAPAHLSYLRPSSAAFLAWEKREEAKHYLDVQPLYLRAPQAERQKNLKELGHE
ncbi:MAG: tRNA (adenosine(37)-N6)-threonylcarbamoyltransferase complex dimerization subunit type 1 TsaB [Clostridiales bacterium]|nr:tRNA (adenosine(37)-N6)-threonylcarbamoyltransferase complex dimerization subunit type 1 TsaB [Clostridiales bacterium]